MTADSIVTAVVEIDDAPVAVATGHQPRRPRRQTPRTPLSKISDDQRRLAFPFFRFTIGLSAHPIAMRRSGTCIANPCTVNPSGGIPSVVSPLENLNRSKTGENETQRTWSPA